MRLPLLAWLELPLGHLVEHCRVSAPKLGAAAIGGALEKAGIAPEAVRR